MNAVNRWWVNPDLLVHVDVSRETIEAGDYVVTGTDSGLTRRIQKHSGMWQDGMEKVGQLMSTAVGMLRYMYVSWLLSKLCLRQL